MLDKILNRRKCKAEMKESIEKDKQMLRNVIRIPVNQGSMDHEKEDADKDTPTT